MRESPWVARCAVAALVCLVTGQIWAGSWVPQFSEPVLVTEFSDFGTNRRAFGLAVGDFDGDDKLDVVASIVNGNVAFVRGNGDGTFEPKLVFDWKQTFFNGWAFAAADINGDGHLDVVWGATANNGPVSDGDVRVFPGTGDGAFEVNEYFVSGVLHNAGMLLANVGVGAGSLATGDIDGNGLDDIVVGSVEGDDTVVKVLFNLGDYVFAAEDVFRRPKSASNEPPIWFAPPGQFGTTRDTIWGLALSDIDGDSDLDLWVGDRVIEAYRFLNDGTGGLVLTPPDVPPLPTRPQVYLAHGEFDVFGYSPSLGSGDLNGDGVGDLVLGLQQGTQTPTSGIAHDGELIIDLSVPGGHQGFAGNPLADIGTKARGVTVADVQGDGFMDILAGNYEGEVVALLQLPPDTDGDGVTDDVDNCVMTANPDQADVEEDGAGDACDVCRFIADPDQPDSDGDGVGDACPCPEETDPNSQGYWHHQCLTLPPDQGGISPGNNGNGPQSPHPRELAFLELRDCSDAVLPNLLPYVVPELATCEALDADPPNDQCQKAEKQLTALLLNTCSGRISEHCAIELGDVGCESETVGDLFFEMAGLMSNGQCNQAKKCAAELNEGVGFVDPADNVGGNGWRLGERRTVGSRRLGSATRRGLWEPQQQGGDE